MSKFAFYDEPTGSIIKVVECNDEDAALNKESDSEKFIQVSETIDVDEENWYIKNGSLTAKEVFHTINRLYLQVGEIRTLAFPEPFTLIIEGDEGVGLGYESTEKTVDLEFETPGDYLLRITMPHFIVNEVTIHVLED